MFSGCVITFQGAVSYVHNLYSSPDLLQFLHLNRTNKCDTMTGNRLGLTEFQKCLVVGEKEVLNDKTSMVVQWIDERQVLLIVTNMT